MNMRLSRGAARKAAAPQGSKPETALSGAASPERPPGRRAEGYAIKTGRMNMRLNRDAAGRGLLWCLGSILLATLAQLSLKWAVSHLPPLSLDAPLDILNVGRPALTALLVGLGGYALSMLCWILALRSLPLNYAYPMLSLSYVLVCLLAAALPGLDEALSLFKAGGILCILLGVWLINTPARH